MTIVAHHHTFVVGVDTHARNHVLSILTATGEQIAQETFPTTKPGLSRAVAWVRRHTQGDLSTLWVIEGAATYGAQLATMATQAGYLVVEAARMSAKMRHGVGKSDQMDATRIASAVLPLEDNRLRHLRQNHGVRAGLRVLVTARDHMTGERTAHINALTGLVRAYSLGIDARRPLTGAQIAEISRWRDRCEDIGQQIARGEAIRLATRIIDLDQMLEENHQAMARLVEQSPAHVLLDMPGIGVVTAAIAFVAWSHPGRLRNEAAFASLAGVNPLPASSGNTIRHRLNRGGDRRLNQALHMTIVVRMAHDEKTKTYVERRTTEGRTKKEIRRSLKRYLARQIYRTLNTTTINNTPNPT